MPVWFAETFVIDRANAFDLVSAIVQSITQKSAHTFPGNVVKLEHVIFKLTNGISKLAHGILKLENTILKVEIEE